MLAGHQLQPTVRSSIDRLILRRRHCPNQSVNVTTATNAHILPCSRHGAQGASSVG